MNAEEFPGINALVRSTICELSNMIAGNAVSILCNRGINLDVTPPSLVSGTDMEISDYTKMQTLVIPIKTPCGEVVINFAIVM